MEMASPEKRLLRLRSLGALAGVVFLLCSCHNAPVVSPVQCAIRVQAQVNIPNASGIGSQTYNEGGVGAVGSWQSNLSGSSNCPGSALSFNGTTAYGTGLYEADGVKMNANWQVAWGWANTNFSACPNYTTQQQVPDSGVVFNDVCHL